MFKENFINMDYDHNFGNYSEDYGYNECYRWNDNNYGVDHSDGNNYGHYQGDYRMGRGYGQARYGPPYYSEGGPGPPKAWGHGFGPEGPSFHQRDEKPSSFLLRCGVPKHHVAGLPKALLDLIGYDSCGICGQEFNSTDMCRLHYISRNHLKLQKKWLAQQTEVGSRRPKEVILLKSRDLYCELCDVHITSKIHAYSHYAGKLHRAIVLGRKQPKNPFLLQTSMKDRLDQLIRREKKSLNFLEETEEKAKMALQRELHCEICKTYVTCSEQMTMHLNGKKHLFKEKKHILSMMKIGKSVNEEPVNENNETPVKAKRAGAEVEIKKNDDGWGYGSTNWDDDPQ